MKRRVRELIHVDHDHVHFYKSIKEKRANGKVCSYVNVDDAEVSRRVGHVVLPHQGSVIVWGGFTQTSRRPERVSVYWKPNWIMWYQPSSQVWHPVWTFPEHCPPPSSSSGAGIVDGKLYVFCGFSVESWDKRMPETNMPDVRNVMEANDEILKKDGIEMLLTMMPGDIGLPYVESNTNDVYCLDLGAKRWKKLQPKGQPPLKCDKLTSWTFEGKVYLFGGYGPPPTQDGRPGVRWQVDALLDDGHRARGWNNQLVVYDPSANAWEWPETFGEVPGPRAAHAADVNVKERYALVFGGRFGPDRLNDLYHLNLDTLRWTMLQPATDDDVASDFSCPVGRSWHTLTHLSGNTFVMFGGYSGNETTLGDCWKFHLNPRDFSRSYWKRLKHLESKERRIWHKSVLVDGGTVMAVGGFGTKCPVGSSLANHGTTIVRLRMSPRSLQSLALDAACLHVHRRHLHLQLKNLVIPQELIEDINGRMAKLLYEKGKEAFVRKNHASLVQSHT